MTENSPEPNMRRTSQLSRRPVEFVDHAEREWRPRRGALALAEIGGAHVIETGEIAGDLRWVDGR